MNKIHKLLSLLLSTRIVVSAFPSSGTGATSESIAFYNSKKSILEMKEYDEVYDTNHDGIVNVFDVIRENKEVFQEESYTDLKSKIYSLETQIEILTQKLAEKEDKTQAESDLSEINSALSGKVDIHDGKQLSSNDYTDAEKQKLEGLSDYDDTSIKSDISEISTALSGKVDNKEGKQLSSNDYTDTERQKLESLSNYDDTSIKSDISEIYSALSGKVDQQDGKRLSSNDYTDEEKQKLESLNNYDDTEIKNELQNQNELIDSLVGIANDQKNKYDNLILDIDNNKVDKEEGKQLSSNDYTNEDKQKLESLNNYDDTNISNEINEIKDCLNEAELDTDMSLFNLSKRMEKHNVVFEENNFVLTIDDCNQYLPEVRDLCDELEIPLSVSASYEKLSTTYGSESVKSILDNVVSNGGEILAHSFECITSSSTDDVYRKVFITEKQKLEENGYDVNGIILSGGKGYVFNAKTYKYASLYYEYSDLYGLESSEQFHHSRWWFHNLDIDGAKTAALKYINNNNFVVMAMHGSSDSSDLEHIDNLKELLLFIKSNGGNFTTWKKVYDKYYK